MTDPTTWLGVCLAAGLGAVVRSWADRAVAALVPLQRMPWATLSVNIMGSFLLGLVLTMPATSAPDWLTILGTGFCGGVTTFSTFTWEALTLMREGRPRTAFGYGVLMIAVTLAAVCLGTGLGHWIW